LFAQYLDRDDSSFASDGMDTPQTSAASTSSASNPRILTPTSTTSAGEGRLLTPSSGFDEGQDDHDPDSPLPSVERDVSSATDRQSTRSAASSSPSLGSPTNEQTEDDDAVIQEISNMRNLRLTSPQTPTSVTQRASRTPSIHVTRSVPPNDTSGSLSRREDSLVANVAALRLRSHRADSLGAAELHDSRSPSPSRRRRSGSGLRRERHQVESEAPPEAFSRMAEVQNTLASARNLPRRMMTVLSSSNLHHEDGSSIHKLYQQAKKLNDFQLPSSRIVGLVGDSGVGKSSLINSLLDKGDLARAVSDFENCIL
jgi:ABC-type glutathione transport system ATPase component